MERPVTYHIAVVQLRSLSGNSSAKKNSPQETNTALANSQLQISHESEHTRLIKLVDIHGATGAEVISIPEAGCTVR